MTDVSDREPPAFSGEGDQPHGLARVLGVWSLTLYGVSVVVGAGVYVALGEVIARAGASAPEELVREVVARLAELRDVQEEEVVTTTERMTFKLPRQLADARD